MSLAVWFRPLAEEWKMLKIFSSNRIGYQYKLSIAAFCFLILMGSNLVFNQGPVALDALVWFCTITLVGGVFGLTFPRSAHSYLLFVVLGSLVFGLGFAECGTILLWLASSWSLGVLALRRLYVNKNLSLISATEAVLVGAAIWLAVWGVMLHFAVNYQALHIVLSLLPCLFLAGRNSNIRKDFISKANVAQEWIQSIPLWWWIAGLVIVGWVLRWTSFPTMGFDDHVLHLRIWTELLTQQRYSFDVSTQIWSVAPFTVDLLHAVLSLMAGHDARGAMNLGLTISLLLLMARILCIWKIPAWAQWLLIVLMVSTPMLGYLLLTLQVELVLAVLALAGMRLVIDANGGWRGQHVLGVLSCVALCAGIKLPGVALGVTLLAALAVRWWSQRGILIPNSYKLRWPALLLLIPLSFIALHPYAVAWKVTGNPVFPLYNSIFLSPYFAPVNFFDEKWVHGFSFSSYFRAFFHTSEFFESGNYVAGWQYLLLLPVAIFAGFRSGIPNGLRIALIPLLGFGVVMFSTTQYWRYLFPIMPIAGVLLAALFIGKNTKYKAFIVALTVTAIAFNLIFFTSISWMMNLPAAAAFTDEGKKSIVRLYAPAALLTEKINGLAPGSRVLYPLQTSYGATLHGTPLYVSWYSSLRATRFGSLKNFTEIGEFLSQEKVDFVITDIRNIQVSGSPEVLLRDYLARFGSVIAQEDTFLLYRISETPVLYRKIFDLGSSLRKTPGEAELLMPFTEKGVQASNEPKPLTVVQAYRSKQARYSVNFICPSESGLFVAQINWDKGAPYYRFITCKPQTTSFVEALPIPVGASTGIVYVTSRDTDSVHVENLSIELH